MIELVAVVRDCIALLRDTGDLGRDLSASRRTAASAERAAMAELLDAVSEALTAAEFMAMLGGVSSATQQQAILAVGACIAFEEVGPRLGVPAASRPLGWAMLAFALSGELVAQHAMRRDVRDVFAVAQKLAVATHSVRRTGSAAACEAATQMLSAVERCFGCLPGVTSPAAALLRRGATQRRHREFREAMQSAWKTHLSLVTPTVTRSGLLRRQTLSYSFHGSAD